MPADPCAICAEALDPSTACTLGCGHMFHERCWLLTKYLNDNRCPICRQWTTCQHHESEHSAAALLECVKYMRSYMDRTKATMEDMRDEVAAHRLATASSMADVSTILFFATAER